jgi:hypothetical protein
LVDTAVSGDCNDDGVVNGQDDAVKATMPVILNLDDQSDGKGLFIHGVPKGTLVSAELLKSGSGQAIIIGTVISASAVHPLHGHAMLTTDGEVSLDVNALYSGGQWVHAFGEKNGFLTVTLVEHFAGGGQKTDVLKVRVVRADMIFRNGAWATAILTNSDTTHGGIDTGDDKIYNLTIKGWEDVTSAAFYAAAAKWSKLKVRMAFAGTYMADRIRAMLFDNLRSGADDYPTGTPKWNIFSSADNFNTANCLEMAEYQWERAIRDVRAQLTDPNQIQVFENAYYLFGATVRPVVSPSIIEVGMGTEFAAEYTARHHVQSEPGYVAGTWDWHAEVSGVVWRTTMLGDPFQVDVLHIITTNSYYGSVMFKKIPYWQTVWNLPL